MAPVGEVPMATTTGNAAVSIVVRKVIAQRNETRVEACVHDVVRVHLTADTDALHRVSAESERHDCTQLSVCPQCQSRVVLRLFFHCCVTELRARIKRVDVVTVFSRRVAL